MILLGVLGWPILTAGRRAVNERIHFAGGVSTPPLTKGDAIAPFGNPIMVFPPQEAGLT